MDLLLLLLPLRRRLGQLLVAREDAVRNGRDVVPAVALPEDIERVGGEARVGRKEGLGVCVIV